MFVQQRGHQQLLAVLLKSPIYGHVRHKYTSSSSMKHQLKYWESYGWKNHHLRHTNPVCLRTKHQSRDCILWTHTWVSSSRQKIQKNCSWGRLRVICKQLSRIPCFYGRSDGWRRPRWLSRQRVLIATRLITSLRRIIVGARLVEK